MYTGGSVNSNSIVSLRDKPTWQLHLLSFGFVFRVDDEVFPLSVTCVMVALSDETPLWGVVDCLTFGVVVVITDILVVELASSVDGVIILRAVVMVVGVVVVAVVVGVVVVGVAVVGVLVVGVVVNCVVVVGVVIVGVVVVGASACFFVLVSGS